jgi:predicted ATPase
MSSPPPQTHPRVGLLGPITVIDGDDETPITSGRARALLTALALAHPRPVGVAALVADAWADRPPQNPAGAVQTQMSRLRQVLGTGSIVGSAAGYRLDLAVPVSDLAVAESLSDLDDDPDGAGAARVLALWRGDAGADLPAGELRDRLRARADRAHRAALEREWHARLSHDPAGVAAEIADVRGDLPLDEHLAALQMRAHLAAGDPNAALRIHAEISAELAERLGADPGPALAAAHSAALAFAPLPHTPAPPADTFLADAGTNAELAEAIARSSLVTIVGPGGIGKTRLITEYIASTRPAEVFVDLSAARHPDDVAAAVAIALGRGSLPEQGTATATPSVTTGAVLAQLSPAGALVVLDTCEHLVAFVADLVDDIRSRRDDLTIIATSTTPLGVPDERIVTVGPLDTDRGVELVTQRARELRSDVHLDRGLLIELCQRLDGSPLALELAAAQLRYLSLADVVGRLDARFGLLAVAGGGRHQRIADVVAASWDLVSPPAQRTLAVLALFPSDVRLDDALVFESVTLPALAELCDHHMASVVDFDDGRTRYRITETVREFVRERTRLDPPTHRALTLEFVSWAADVVASTTDDLIAGRVGDAAGRLDESTDAVLAALDDPATAAIPGAVARLLPITLWRLVRTGGYPDAERLAVIALDHPGSPDDVLGLLCATAYLMVRGRFREAARARTRLRATVRRAPATAGPIALAVDIVTGSPHATARILADATRSPDAVVAALAEIIRSDVAEFYAAVHFSRRCALAALVCAERAGHPWLIAAARQRLGRGHALTGDRPGAAALYARSADDFATIGFSDESTGIRIHQALALSPSDPAAAAEILEACLLAAGDSRRPHVATAHMALSVLRLPENPQAARRSADTAIAIIGAPHDGHSAYLHGVRAVILARSGAEVAARLAADALGVALRFLVAAPTVNLPALAGAAAAICLVENRAADDPLAAAARGAHYRRDFAVIDLGEGPRSHRRSLIRLVG